MHARDHVLTRGKRVDANSSRQKFAGSDTEDGDFFDESFAGLATAAYKIRTCYRSE
jgi:hypothetical protein